MTYTDLFPKFIFPRHIMLLMWTHLYSRTIGRYLGQVGMDELGCVSWESTWYIWGSSYCGLEQDAVTGGEQAASLRLGASYSHPTILKSPGNLNLNLAFQIVIKIGQSVQAGYSDRCYPSLLPCFMGFPGSSDGKESTYDEIWVKSLGQEDPLEEGMAIHSTILAWRIPWRGEPGGLQSMSHKELDTIATNHFTSHFHLAL